MTEIEQKALALVSEVLGVRLSLFERSDSHIHEALCRAIEQNEALKAEKEQWKVYYYEAVRHNFQLLSENAKMREALKRIARYDVGLQALIEDGVDTPENRAKYYEGRVEYRRMIALKALQETGQ